MTSRGTRGGVPAHKGEPRHEEQTEQQAPAPQGLVLPPPPPVDYGMFMQGLVQAMQTQAHTHAALQAQMEAQMKDYDAILGLDWLEEHYALVDYRRKRIVFRIPGEDEFSHPLPRNLAGKLVISAMKAMSMMISSILVLILFEGRPGVVSRVVFPSVVMEDLVGYPGWYFSLHVKEDQLRLGVRVLMGDSTIGSEILRYCLGTGCRTPVKRSSEPG
ncbi:hypothetical protein Taro_010100 [Colocasia esculenta]|uniref:Uncharacterized protein n=1 Tax=Colocasia esculenta TaxID=4460 RepID=A0A843U7G2_COLES|nr:hypothetical protein [Colocasia esculenta]